MTSNGGVTSGALAIRSDEAPALSVRGLSKTFGSSRVLSSLELQLAQGEIHALLGENGSGKSTFIKILAGLHVPDPGGHVEVDGTQLVFGRQRAAHDLGCRFVHQDLGLIESESVLDNLALDGGYPRRFGTIRGRAALKAAAADLERVGLDLDPRSVVAKLSPAQRSGVAIARALDPDAAVPTRLLVLDEPTAALPGNEVERLLGILRAVANAGVAVLYVTHRLDEVHDVAENLTVLRDGRKVATRPVDGLTRPELINLLVGEELSEAKAAANTIHADGPTLLTVEGLRGENLSGISFTARGGEVLGIAGITGSGSDAVLGTIFGAIPREGGEVAVRGRQLRPGAPSAAVAAGMAYVPRDRKALGAAMALSARENLTLSDLSDFWRKGWLRLRQESSECRVWFRQLSVRPADAHEAPFASFSGGNQQKIVFARCLRLKPAVFLLDEPTQGVDVGAKAELHAQLLDVAARGGTVVAASSDADELVALCRRVLVVRHGRIVEELSGERLTVKNIARAALGETKEIVVT